MTSEQKRRGRPVTRAVTTVDSVRVGDTTIEYQVRRSQRRKKTVQIRVDRSGVKVAASKRIHKSELQAIVLKRASWILKQMSDTSASASATPMRFATGETLPFLGRDVPIVIQSADVGSAEVRIDLWTFQITTPNVLDEDERSESIRLAVVGWYTARAAETLASSVDRWWPRLGRGEQSRILIRNQRQRWASCSYDGTLRFNWRIMTLEPSLVEYIVVHELAHLTHLNHSKDFWALVYDVMPEAPERRRRLRKAAWALSL